MVPIVSQRGDLFVTTSLHPSPELETRARGYAEELNAPYVRRRDDGMPVLFRAHPEAERALLVQATRLLLVSRDGAEIFYHPNMAFLRLGNLLRGGRDLLIEAADLRRGDRVLDCTLGHAAEAILCAHTVGEEGVVHGVEAVPEMAVMIREGLKTVVTDHAALNAAMRRIVVAHIGPNLEYLRTCPDGAYDVVCFDPFFEEELPNSETFVPLRAFGHHAPLEPEALAEAQRVARRRVVVKAVRWASTLDDLGITQRHESRRGKVVYGVLSGYSGAVQG